MTLNIVIKGLSIERQFKISKLLSDYVKAETTAENVTAYIEYYLHDKKSFINNEEVKKSATINEEDEDDEE